jgi:hypothetical protein
MRKAILMSGLMVLFSLPSISMASFSCKSGTIVEVGQTETEVKLNCGPPMSATYVGRIDKVYVDRWVYDLGPGTFYQILDFHNNVLFQIRNGPRVPG